MSDLFTETPAQESVASTNQNVTLSQEQFKQLLEASKQTNSQVIDPIKEEFDKIDKKVELEAQDEIRLSAKREIEKIQEMQGISEATKEKMDVYFSKEKNPLQLEKDLKSLIVQEEFLKKINKEDFSKERQKQFELKSASDINGAWLFMKEYQQKEIETARIEKGSSVDNSDFKSICKDIYKMKFI